MSIFRKQLKDGAVVFQAYGRRNGEKHYLGTFSSRREAEEREEDDRVTQRKIARGELAPRTDVKRTFCTAIEQWVKSLKEHGSASADEYSNRMELHALPIFKDVPLVDIRKSDVLLWRDDLSTRVAAPTVNVLMGTLSSAFSWFVDRDWISANPCSRVKKIRHEAKVFPWIQSGEMITKLLAELRTNIRTLCAVLVGTGMRLQEALSLQWPDIDLEHRLITIRKSKGKRVRRVPIFDSVLPVLKEMRLARGASVFLWPGGKPGKPLSQPSVRIAFKEAAEIAELPKELRVHDLRHTFASLFLIDGGDIFKLSRILGHSSVAITERTYAHLKPDAFEADYGRVAFRMPSNNCLATLRAVS